MAEKTRCKGGTKSEAEIIEKIDLIRQEYKRYKKKKPPPDFGEVLDFEKPETFRNRVSEFRLKKFPHAKYGLKCARKWEVYHLVEHPGLLYIVNPFSKGAQHYWTRRCLEDFPRKPNVSNLDTHMAIGDDMSIWEMSQSEGDRHNLIDRLRWVHLGYQFDYNVVDYKPEKYYGFPEDLSGLMQHIAETIGYPGYIPEAGIINYYPLGASMGGHTDHYELDLNWPLISVSFGQTAVFLIGGKTRDIMPTALYIRSGDILVMSEEARLAFHAVPRIVQVNTIDQLPKDLQWKSIKPSDDIEQHPGPTCQCNNLAGNTDKLLGDIEQNPGPPCQCNELARNTDNVITSKAKSTGINCGVDGSASECQEDKVMECSMKENVAAKESREVHSHSSDKGQCSNNHEKVFADFCDEQICYKTDAFMVGHAKITKDEWQPFADYLSKNRININVRQVHSPQNTVRS